jgi:hypothetical protein
MLPVELGCATISPRTTKKHRYSREVVGMDFSKILERLIPMVPEPMREMVGVMLGLFLFMGLVYAIGFGPMYLLRLVREPTKQCWDIKGVEGRVFKVNSCTGEVVPIPPPESTSN